MSTFTQKRCNHCGTTYSYQMSGYGGMQTPNNPTYCPPCATIVEEAIRVALEPVSVLFDREWRPTQDITIAEMDRLDDERVVSVRADGGIPVWAVMSPLFDMERPSNVQHQKLLHHNGRTYRYEWWTDEGVEHGVVYIECSVELATGNVVGPWRLTDRWDPWPTFYEPGPKPPPKPPTHEWVANPFAQLVMPRMDLISRDQSLGNVTGSLEAAFRATEERAASRLTDVIPDGALPFYDKEPDVGE